MISRRSAEASRLLYRAPLEDPHMKNVCFAFVLLSFVGLAGCDESIVEKIDEETDCRAICGRYEECFDEDYDVEGCVDRCNDMTDADGGDPHAADECEACIDERSCTESVFPCAAECASIVP